MSLIEEKVVEQLPALLRYARLLTRSEPAAEDLVHDTLVSAYANRTRFDPARPLRVWLFAILRNRFISDRRRVATRDRHLSDFALLSPEQADPQQEHAIRLDDVARRIRALPPEQAAVLHLVVVEGMSYQDAAAALEIPIGTLMSRLSRARSRLRAAEEAPLRVNVLRLVKD